MRYFSFTASLHFLRYLQQYAIALLVFVPAIVLATIGPPPESTKNDRPYSIIVIPDTQYYTVDFPATFISQTSWIAEQKSKLNIKFAIHLGDIVEHANSKDQWLIADAAMAKLDGVVPYSIMPGNHDITADGASEMYSNYFSTSRFKNDPTWKGSFFDARDIVRKSQNKSSYHAFDIGGDKFMVISLEFCPSDEVLSWANYLIDENPDRFVIVTTHSYLSAENELSPTIECAAYTTKSTTAREEIWTKLIKNHPNIRLVLSGHDNTTSDGAARRTDFLDGKPVHQLLSDYQHLGRGGDGYLRIMTFYPNEKKIKVFTYSPYLDTYRDDPENQFELKIN